VFLSHCAMRLKKSGTVVPKMELVEVGPSMDLVVRRHRLPNEGLRKEAMKTVPQKTKKVSLMTFTMFVLRPPPFKRKERKR